MKYKFSIFALILAGFSFLSTHGVLAYSTETHAYLTREVFDFYNINFSNNKIPNDLKDYLLDGSRREDDVPRWMNHFYDPVHNRGLTYDPAIDAGINFGSWQASKDWAKDEDNQNKTTYKVPATIASILTAIQQQKLSIISNETDFTWQQAIRYYVNGEKEKAMFALGHVLHLIEDVSVPDHTRNDSHPGDSPYENWTAQFDLNNIDGNLSEKLQSASPFIFGDLDSYFDGLAKYSNNNFYSKDTLGVQSGFSIPISDYVIQDGKYFYAFRESVDDSDYKLFAYKNYNGTNLLEFKSNISLDFSDDGYKVLKDYWSRLSVKAVQYGAGVIDLFFKEVEKAKNDPNFVKESPKTLLATVVDAAQNIINAVTNTVQNAASTLTVLFSIPKPVNVQEQTKVDEQPSEIKLSEVESPGMKIDEAVEQVKPIEEAVIIEEVPSSSVLSAAEIQEQIINIQNQLNEIEKQVKELPQSAAVASIQSVAEVAGNNPVAQVVSTSGSSGGGGSPGNPSSNQPADTIAPAMIADLRAASSTVFSVTLEWTSPGGDNNSGTASAYDVRYSTSTITSGNWSSSTQVNGEPAPLSAGAVQSMTIHNFLPNTTYYFAIKTSDETLNLSLLSDVLSVTTPSLPQGANHIVISEVLYDATGADSGKEFIEFHNPTGSEIDISDWSLRILRADATSSASLADFSQEHKVLNISPRSYFLIGFHSYEGETAADVLRAYDLPNGSQTAIYLLDGSGTIIDQLTYNDGLLAVEENAGQSLERKAWQDNSCVSAQANNEFLGNGCDEDSYSDFEVRNNPNPQNSGSLPEVREAPTAPAPAIGSSNILTYNSSTLTLIFNWQPSRDVESSTSTLKYKIFDASNASSTQLVAETVSTTFSRSIDEVGRDYNFEMIVLDRDGLSSATTSLSFNVPSFLDNLYFYRDPRGASSAYLIDLYYSGQPFIPPIFSSPTYYPAWQGMVFYQNQPANKDNRYLYGEGFHWPDDKTGVVPLSYPRCVSGPFGYSLIMPLAAGRCGLGGGLNNSSLDFSLLEDNHLLIALSSSTSDISFSTTSDYLTVAYYDFSSSGGGNQPLNLVAVDSKKYYFQSSRPGQNMPQLGSGEISVNFEKQNSRIILNWPTAADSDTLDNRLSYEINFSPASSTIPDDSLWRSAGNITTYRKFVALDSDFLIGIRAKDDFGNVSAVATTTWAYPTTNILFEQNQANNWSNDWGIKRRNQPTDPDSVSLQSFTSSSTVIFDKAVVRLWRVNRDYGEAVGRLAVYADSGSNRPDFTNKLDETTISHLDDPDHDQDVAFSFSSAVTLMGGSRYWFVLDISQYADNSGYFTDSWRNAINQGIDAYPQGEAGGANANVCPPLTYCNFYIPSPDATADWYLKLGLEQ